MLVRRLAEAPTEEWHKLRTNILMDAGELGSRNMSVTWLEVPSGIDQELHSHEEAEQVYVVTKGSGSMTVAGDKQEITEGDLVMVPPATDHSIANDGGRRPLLRLDPEPADHRLRGLRQHRRGRRLRLRRRGVLRSVRKRVVAHGRVQGVFFRDSVRRRAESLGVSGWARNRDDGTVEAEFEGDAEAVESMLEYCRSGPGRAEVERLEVSELETEGSAGFEIR